jgi:hypothetical protein
MPDKKEHCRRKAAFYCIQNSLALTCASAFWVLTVTANESARP